MPNDDRDDPRNLALDDYWERVVRGDRASPKHLDPSLATTVSRLHARDATPGPDAAFVGRLWGDLMQTTVPSDRALIVAAAPPSPNGHAPRLATSVSAAEPVRLPRTRPVAAFATAAILLLTLVSGFGAYRLATPETDWAPTALIASWDATPVAAMCTVPPSSRPIPSSGMPMFSLDARYRVAYTADGAVFDAIVDLSNLPPGTPADTTAIAGIRTTIGQIVACFTLADTQRWRALFSDDFYRRGSANACPPMCGGENFDIPTWVVEGGRVRDARVMTDRRVGSVVETTESAMLMFIVFVEQDGRWLIDEVATIETSPVDVCLSDEVYGTPLAVALHQGGTPAAAYGGTIYVGDTVVGNVRSCTTPAAGAPKDGAVYAGGVVYVDDMNTLSGASDADVTQDITIIAESRSFSPFEVIVRAGSPLSLTIENLTDEPIGFVIDTVGIDLQLGAGETRGITFTPPPGVYTYYSDVPGQREAGMVGTLTVE